MDLGWVGMTQASSMVRGGSDFKVDFKVDIKRDYRVIWIRNGQGWFQLKFKGST